MRCFHAFLSFLSSFFLLFTLLLSDQCTAFYVPGVAPNAWKKGEEILLNVNKMTSVRTLVPYEYYYLPFCRPQKRNEQHENLGEIMAGDMIENSLYRISMKETQKCSVLCRPLTYTNEQVRVFIDYIKDEYYIHWILDNLPVLYRTAPELNVAPIRGYPIGDTDIYGEYFIYNHVILKIKVTQDVETDGEDETDETYETYKTDAETGKTDETEKQENPNAKWQIVGFEVEPISIRHVYNETELNEGKNLNSSSCNDKMNIRYYSSIPAEEVYSETGIKHQYENYQYLDSSATETNVLYTYDVEFFESTIPWEHRWDEIIASKNATNQIHWFSIINSLMIVLFLTGMIAMILLRTVHRDITKYNELQTMEDANEETGWKLVHGDVFRPPQSHPMFFCVFIGTGVQILMMTMLTMLIALLGLLSPANRGSLLTTLLLLYVFMGAVAGYHSARTYKLFSGKNWKRNTLCTALMYPSVVFAIFFLINLVLWIKVSSQAVPFGTFFSLLLLWLGISMPLVYLGSYFGYRHRTISLPVRINQIARQIPTCAWYLSAPFSVFVGGILPFGAVFIELFFIMSALWMHQIYYVFGFLFLVLLILLATCAEVTIVLCYFQLCAEDYQWWWRSFLTSGSAGIYLFFYSILYFYTKLEITAFVSALLYFGYMAIISFTFFLLTGSIGYFACLSFTKKIYSSIKID